MRRPELTLPTFLGLMLTVAGLATGMILLKNPLRTLIGASGETIPQNIKPTNITDTGFTVSWTTTKATSGFVRYGESTPELTVSDNRDQEKGSVGNYFTHFVSLKGLKSHTNYKYRVGTDEQIYDITTAASLSNPPISDVAYGQVVTDSGEPAEGALVYLQLPGVVPQATLVKSSGAWVIPLSTARTADLTSYAAYNKNTTQIQIFVDAGPLGTATAITTTGEDSPVKAITLGSTTILPTPTILQAAPESKFNSQSLQISTSKSKDRIIMGKAPPGSEITIEVHSKNNINDTVTTDESGNFTYTVPENLEPGTHTVTVSTLVDGVIKKVTKSFVVEAAYKPTFTASPSATLKPTPKPKPTLAPRVSYPDTSNGTPKTGDLTSTLLLLILGTGLITAGLFAYGFNSAATKS